MNSWLRSLFILVWSLVSIGYLICLVGNTQGKHPDLELSVFSFIACCSLPYFVYFLSKALRIQQIHQKKSYIFYLIIGILLLALAYGLSVMFCKEDGEAYCLLAIFQSLVLICYPFIKEPQENKQFAPGSVSIENDGFGFADSARQVSRGMAKNNQDYLLVYGLDGDLGWGKSSYTRMIVEALEEDSCLGKDKFLYTYISLTETNEARDFSRLFSERWLNTLKSRYPILPLNPASSILSTIFRENNMGLFSSMIACAKYINFGLMRTKAKVWDPTLGSEPDYVESKVASLFANIPKIEEQLWLIVVDEVERAPTDEIFRLIEAIERFKYLGRTGLPIQIVFFLCMSREDLKKRIVSEKGEEFLISHFFFKDAKNITNKIYLPIVSKETRAQYIINKIEKYADLDNLASQIDWNNLPTYPIKPAPNDNYVLKEKESAAYIINLLADESPRMIDRCLQEIHFFSQVYQDTSGSNTFEAIFLGDILGLSLVRIKYPHLINFLSKTVDVIQGQESTDLVKREHLKEEVGKKLENWFIKLSIAEVSNTEIELMCILAHAWIVFLNSESRYPEYKKRTSNPYIMKQYLNLSKRR